VQVFTTVPLHHVGDAPEVFEQLERVGYDGGFTYETSHDPFIPLALAASRTTSLRLGTAVAIGFARTPMTLANLGYDLQDLSRGRFILGLGSQIRPHITKRYSMPWSRPAARMREMVLAIRAIWDAWDGIAPLAFKGEFYTHTLMTPVFDPGPHAYGRAPIHLACVGPKMTAVGAEVADGIMVHPFSTRKSLEEITMPGIERGLAAAGRDRADLEVVVVCMVATGRTGRELDEAIAVVRGQLAFYGSTPAYAPVLECHGWGDLHPKLNALSKQGRWADMAALVPDEVVETIAVVGLRDEIGPAVRARVAGLADTVSIECTRRPDPEHFADIVASVRGDAVS
jgi:probable F420-dependent oxidoreductase